MSETFETITRWADESFGPATVERQYERAAEEMIEFIDELPGPKKLMEAADVVICLARLPGLQEAIDQKMAINRARKWAVRPDGTAYHIKTA